jgi:1-acyl-sn-glycerol-3-phosphate acyltransferase
VLLDIIHSVILYVVKAGLVLTYDMEHRGLENIPKDGPVVFVSNHTTIIDSFLIGCYLPRKIHFMTKSTEFESPVRRIFFYLSRTFPVRRYGIDPVAIRNAFRILDFGGMVGIYPEGERTWDGEMQPFRKGTIRFLLAAGVPVIPASIHRAFQHQPRFGGKIGKPKIHITVGKPIIPERKRGSQQTRADVESFRESLEDTIRGMSPSS